MNNLNSILIEGTVARMPIAHEHGYKFLLDCTYYKTSYDDSGVKKITTYTFPVPVCGKVFCKEYFLDNVEVGAKIRVVGALRPYDAELIVEAEHFEMPRSGHES